MRGTAAATLTVLPSEPAGQVPIAGLSPMPTAKAGMVNVDGSTSAAGKPGARLQQGAAGHERLVFS